MSVGAIELQGFIRLSKAIWSCRYSTDHRAVGVVYTGILRVAVHGVV